MAKSARDRNDVARPASKAERAPARGAAAAPSLDRIIHERLRLGIVSALAATEALTFNELKQVLGTSDGNLSVHARRLEDAGYVLCTKSFQGRTPRSEYRLTAAGRRALQKYVGHMESVISAMKK